MSSFPSLNLLLRHAAHVQGTAGVPYRDRLAHGTWRVGVCRTPLLSRPTRATSLDGRLSVDSSVADEQLVPSCYITLVSSQKMMTKIHYADEYTLKRFYYLSALNL